MAKHKESHPSSPGKMTIILIQLEGSDATLQEGIRTFKEAMGRAVPHMLARPQLPQSAIVSLPPPEVESDGNGNMNGETQECVDDAAGIELPASSAPSARAKPTSPRQFPKMTLVKDLDLRPSEKPHLKDWLAEKKPKTQMETIAACVYYLRRVLEVPGVTANHVFTCLDDAKMTKIPNDLPQILRNIASRKGWVDLTDSNAIEITTKGINFIDYDLPKRNGS